jgi:hypothetical protein
VEEERVLAVSRLEKVEHAPAIERAEAEEALCAEAPLRKCGCPGLQVLDVDALAYGHVMDILRGVARW